MGRDENQNILDCHKIVNEVFPKWLCVFSAAHTLRQSKLQIRTFYAFAHKKHWMLVCPVIGRIQIILPQYLARLIIVHVHYCHFCISV